MNRQRLEKIDKVFQAALEVPHDRRATFLEDVCAGDTELRVEVESLLAAREDSADFINHSAVAAAA